jgi:hypothetical protein
MNIRTIVIIVGAIALTLFSCNKQENRNRYIIAMDDIKFKQLEGKVVIKGDDDLTIGFELLIIDSLCILIDFTRQGNIFRIYDIENFNKVRFFGEIGQGPNDFTSPPSFISTVEKDKFSAFDMNQARITEFCITDRDSISIASTRSMFPLLHSYSLNQIDDNRFAGRNPSGADGLFFIYDYSQDAMRWISYSTKHDIDIERSMHDLYIGPLRINAEKNIIVCALRFFNRILFFDLDGNHIKEVQIGSKELFPEWNEEWNMVCFSSVTYFLDMCITADHIYALWVEGLFHQAGEFEYAPSKVFVFNWEKELVSALQLDMPITRIAVSKDSAMLLGFADDGTGLTDVIKYDIRGILK